MVSLKPYPAHKLSGVEWLGEVPEHWEISRLKSYAMTGAAGQQRVPSSFVANYLIALPPFAEQSTIVEYLINIFINTDKAITRIRKEIELLKEYRTRLIADVVTGKLDVRAAAHRLPDGPKSSDMAKR